jgi:hypothetical protein
MDFSLILLVRAYMSLLYEEVSEAMCFAEMLWLCAEVTSYRILGISNGKELIRTGI